MIQNADNPKVERASLPFEKRLLDTHGKQSQVGPLWYPFWGFWNGQAAWLPRFIANEASNRSSAPCTQDGPSPGASQREAI